MYYLKHFSQLNKFRQRVQQWWEKNLNIWPIRRFCLLILLTWHLNNYIYNDRSQCSHCWLSGSILTSSQVCETFLQVAYPTLPRSPDSPLQPRWSRVIVQVSGNFFSSFWKQNYQGPASLPSYWLYATIASPWLARLRTSLCSSESNNTPFFKVVYV